MSLFGENSLFHRGFSFLGKLIALNLLWILCSIPVVTLGATTTALYYCTLKLHKDGDCNVFRDFFKSFRQNFFQASLIWIIILAIGGCLYMESRVVPTMPGIMPQIFSYLLLVVCILMIMVVLYVFPTLAAFDNKTGKMFTNALYFGAKNVGFVFVVAAITVLPMFFTLVDAKLFPVYLFIWLTCGFSLTAYADSWFFWKLFKPYFQEEGAEEVKIQETDQYVF